MAISKFSKRVVTVLYGAANKEFELERLREDEKPAQTARRLIKVGLAKVMEDRVALNKKSSSVISRLRSDD